MSATCPKCNKPLSWSIGERLTPKLRGGYILTCPHCGTKLIMDYWSFKQWSYRNLLGLSIILFYFILQSLNITFWLLMSLLMIYIFLVIYVYFRVRKAIFADSRLNQSNANKHPWEKT